MDLVEYLFGTRVQRNTQAPGNLSIWVAPIEEDRFRSFHRLYETHRLALRTKSLRRTLDLLWHELDGWVRRSYSYSYGDTDRLLIDTVVAIHMGRAHLLDARWRRALAREERRWVRAGFRILDRRWVELHLRSRSIEIAPSGLAWDDTALEYLHQLHPIGDRVEPQPKGIFPIASWSMDIDEVSLASRVLALGGCVLDRERYDGQTLIDGLASFAQTIPVLSVKGRSLDELRVVLLEM
jgi:hypothetical protein